MYDSELTFFLKQLQEVLHLPDGNLEVTHSSQATKK
jgi:hypothetical protein